MKVTIEKATKGGDELVIRIPLGKPTPSSSGKTLVVASSHGNQKTECELKGYGPITVGVNAYVKPGQKDE